MRWLWCSRAVRLAFGAFVTGVLILGASLWEALRPHEVRAAGGMVAARDAIDDSARPEGYSLERVLAAVGKDPFHPERRRPGARFQLPAQAAARAARRPPPEPNVRVVGTAVAVDGGGFAMCAVAGSTPRIVRLGDRVGEWTLRRVTPGAAEFTTRTGATVVLRVQKVGGGT